MGRRKTRRGWPTKDGRPLTRAEFVELVERMEAWSSIPPIPAPPHFCSQCSMPLESTPCHVCAKVAREKAAELRALLAQYHEVP